MNRVKISEERCKGCGFCVISCPRHIISFQKHINAKGYHPVMVRDMDKCTACGVCYQVCPDVAIEVWQKVSGK